MNQTNYSIIDLISVTSKSKVKREINFLKRQMMKNRRKFKTFITIPWPRRSDSADPNAIYRPWLEKHVGKQLVDWDWLGAYYSANSLDVYFNNEMKAFEFLM